MDLTTILDRLKSKPCELTMVANCVPSKKKPPVYFAIIQSESLNPSFAEGEVLRVYVGSVEKRDVGKLEFMVYQSDEIFTSKINQELEISRIPNKEDDKKVVRIKTAEYETIANLCMSK
jgi:hypothetical protein